MSAETPAAPVAEEASVVPPVDAEPATDAAEPSVEGTAPAEDGETPTPVIETAKAPEALRARLRPAFALFELESKTMRNMCDERELPTLVRSLGYNPSQDQLKELLLDIRGDDPATGFMSYERVERALARMLETQRREMARDSEDKIIAAFRALDPEGRGYIEQEELRELLMSKGDALKIDEVEKMFEVALVGKVDEKAGKLYYEDFAAVLADDRGVFPE